MDNLSNNNVETALIEYRLLACNVEAKAEASSNSGGILEIISAFSPPTTPSILKKNDPFAIKISVSIIGKSKDSKEISFSASCVFEGDYRLINCEKNGVPIEDSKKLWSLAINQLHPLVSQFVTEIVLKMGFKNVIVPPIILGQYIPLSTKKALSTKTKSIKAMPTKAKK